MKFVIEGVHTRAAAHVVRMVVEADDQEGAVLEFWSRCLQPDMVNIEAVVPTKPNARVTTRQAYRSLEETRELVQNLENYRLVTGS